MKKERIESARDVWYTKACKQVGWELMDIHGMLIRNMPLSHPQAARREAAHGVRHVGQVRFSKETDIEDPVNFLYSERLIHAMAFATKLHQDHARKGSVVPYVSHLQAVASLVMEYAPIVPHSRLIEIPSPEFPNGITLEDAVIAAWLHDAVEDRGGMQTERKIKEKFGDTVDRLVMYCSNLPDPGSHLSYNEKQRRYLRQVAAGPATALLISGADKLHNLQCTLHGYWDQGDAIFNLFGGKTREMKLQYYRDVVTFYGQTGKHPALVRHIELTLQQLEELIARSPKVKA